MGRPLVILLVVLLAASGCPGCQGEDEDCPSGQTLCNGVCRDAAYFQTSPLDCGVCGVACGAGTCEAGTCRCEPGAIGCATNPKCTDTQTDPQNCGGCGIACDKPGATCAAGECGCHAPASTDCGGYCADTQSDAQNCAGAGGCGQACPLSNDVCLAGVCQCPEALPTTCGNTCVNTLTDPRNCGPDAASCGNACPLANEICAAGVCQCPDSLPVTCADSCVDTRTDPQNCGECGVRCPATAACGGTTPQCVCPLGQTLCGHTTTAAGTCATTATDALNCGGCGIACDTGHPCCAGGCCAGTGACCASGACQTVHDNGLGGTYFDCGQVDQWTAEQAALAAASWMPTGVNLGFVPSCGIPTCLCREGIVPGTTRTDAAVWCYQGSGELTGHVRVTSGSHCPTAACPFGTSAAWH